jgi:hypothetical protein
LTLSETGWQVKCWNADDVVIAPAENVLLAIGRRDAMCQEFYAYSPNAGNSTLRHVRTEGVHPLIQRRPPLSLAFDVEEKQAAAAAYVILSTADQCRVPSRVAITVNGKHFIEKLPAGYGLQKADWQHLARPDTIRLAIPPGTLKAGGNQLAIAAAGWDQWFTLDSLFVVAEK